MKPSLYSYPIRGFGMIAIYLFLGPAIQTIIGVYVLHAWQGGADLLLEIVNVFQNEARPRILAGYSFYLPSVFLSGIFCSLPVSRGLGLSLKSAIWRTVLVMVIIAIFYILIGSANMEAIFHKDNVKLVFFTAIQAFIVAWFCWILASGFRLDKDIKH